MAWTFTKVSYDHAARRAIYTATTNTSSAAGTISCGFVPDTVDVYDSTNASHFHWNKGIADAKCFKHVTAGTLSFEASNGITPVSTTAAQGVTLGTALHTNSSTYSIVLQG